MPSERIQKRIEHLLDQADAAAESNDWQSVRTHARAVLVADADNGDAKTLLAMADELHPEPGVGTSAVEPESTAEGEGEKYPEPVEGYFSPPTSTTAELPKSFANGRYIVKSLLGEGGKKKVYLAHDITLDRDVAFGLIKAEGLDEASRQRVTREAQAMGRLGDHPNIMPIFDLGDENGLPYMVQPLMSGGDVETLIADAEDGRLTLDVAIRIASEICSGLEFAHVRGIIHRDLKPGNVWLTAEGSTRIGDFGLAISLDRSRLTQEKMMIGTVRYMPPEQATGGEITPQADLYSLGAMLYEMTTGRPPFMGDDDIAIIGQHINTPPVAPSWHNQTLPQTLDSLIMRLLSKDPAERPTSATEVLSALQAIETDPQNGGPLAPSPLAGEGGGERAPAVGSLDSMASGAFVGRHREMDALKAAFEDTLGGHGKMAALVGEPGIGKTRTAQELATYAAMRGGQVLWGRCYEGGGAPPYYPWIQAIRSYVTDSDAETVRTEMGSTASIIAEIVPDVTERLPDLAPPQNIDDPEAARFRLFDAITTFLKTAANAKPIVLMLEDLHWSDNPSLKLLEFVARELANSRIMIVINYRDMELNRRHPLSITLGELGRERLFDRVLLRGLQKHDVRRFIEVAAGIDPPAALVDAVFTQTEGNPLFVTETVRLLIQEGDITSGEKTGGGTSSWEIRIPEGVREVIGRRLDRLSERCNEVLTIAAVVGRQFRFGVLLNLVDDVSENMLLDVLDEALNARIIEEVTIEVGLYQFNHALMQETLTSELSANRTVRLHARIAEALEAFYGDDAKEHAQELAEHFGEAETVLGAERLVPYLIAAGKSSSASYDFADAAGYFERALQIVGPESRDIQTADLLADLSIAQSFTLTRHEQQSTIETRVKSFEIYMAFGEVEKAIDIAAAYFPSLHGPTGLVGILEEALRHVQVGTRTEGMLQALYSQRVSIETGQYEPAMMAHDRAIEIARELDDPNLELEARVRMLSVHSWHLKTEGRVQEVLEGIKILDKVDLPSAEVEMHNYAASILSDRGETDASLLHVTAATRIAETIRSTDVMIQSAMSEAKKALNQGDWASARVVLVKAMEFDSLDPRILLLFIEIECLTGELSAAREIIDRVAELAKSFDAEETPHQLAATSLGRMIMLYNDFVEEPYLLDVAARHEEFQVNLKTIEPIVRFAARGFLLSIRTFEGPNEDMLREFNELASLSTAYPGQMGLGALRLGAIEEAIRLLGIALSESRAGESRPYIAFYAAKLAEVLNSRNAAGDREQATQLQDEAITIAQKLGMKTVLQRILAQREFLKS